MADAGDLSGMTRLSAPTGDEVVKSPQHGNDGGWNAQPLKAAQV
jgi:hypothetical protein